MKLSTIFFASAVALAAFGLIAHGAFAEDKNSADGAAKGQATEGMEHATKGHHKVKHGKAHHKPRKSHIAVKGSGVPENAATKTSDGKHISDGAAKGQATEGIAPKTGDGGGGQPDKTNNTTSRSNTQHN